VKRRADIGGYLEALAAVALEVSRRPELLEIFIGIVKLVPQTVTELARADARRLAA
jgi:hypothetical protein